MAAGLCESLKHFVQITGATLESSLTERRGGRKPQLQAEGLPVVLGTIKKCVDCFNAGIKLCPMNQNGEKCCPYGA